MAAPLVEQSAVAVALVEVVVKVVAEVAVRARLEAAGVLASAQLPPEPKLV